MNAAGVLMLLNATIVFAPAWCAAAAMRLAPSTVTAIGFSQ
jgi:hypothetical protein